MASEPGYVLSPGNLFFAHPEMGVFWQGPMPALDLKATLGATNDELASWFLSYATMDLLNGVEWQLAGARDDLSTNPFAPLLAIYSQGLWPLSFSPTRMVLFAFAPGS